MFIYEFFKFTKKKLHIYTHGQFGDQKSVKWYNENSSDSHFLIYGPVLANDSLKFLSWLDLKNYVYIYIHIYTVG